MSYVFCLVSSLVWFRFHVPVTSYSSSSSFIGLPVGWLVGQLVSNELALSVFAIPILPYDAHATYSFVYSALLSKDKPRGSGVLVINASMHLFSRHPPQNPRKAMPTRMTAPMMSQVNAFLIFRTRSGDMKWNEMKWMSPKTNQTSQSRFGRCSRTIKPTVELSSI